MFSGGIFVRFGRILFLNASLLSVMYAGLWGLLRISTVRSPEISKLLILLLRYVQ